jgi:hypothetical protein
MRAINVGMVMDAVSKVIDAGTPKAPTLGPVQHSSVVAPRSAKANTFLHSGDLGDIIYGMPAMRDSGGGVLYLMSTPEITKPMTQARFDAVAPLIKAQKYIDDVRWWRGESISHNFAQFRSRYKRTVNLSETQAVFIGTDPKGWAKPWLEVQAATNDRVIIHRSPRYHSHWFPWRAILDHFKSKVLYCGVKDEFEAFVALYGPVDFYQPKDFLELGKIIAGSALFIGNQSSPYAVAEGLKHRSIQETFEDVPDVRFPRDNAAFVMGDVIQFRDGDYTLELRNPYSYWRTENASRPVTVHGHRIDWIRTSQIAGAWRGVCATNRGDEIAFLQASVGKGVSEISREEYELATST